MLKDFLDKANSIHNNFYNYSLVDYKNNKTKVKIICPIHGEFEQTPINHTNGQGCRKCYLNQLPEKNRKSQDKLLEEFYMTHKDRYDYSLVHYKNNITNIKIICPIHGEFQQTPKNHINGHGCPLCATEYKKQKLSKSNLNFVNESKNRHNNFYKYDKAEYINSSTKIIVTCPIHGDFKITPSHHLSGIGCNKCSNNHVPTNEEFIIKANKIHNNKYNYSLVEYKNNKTKVKIICSTHGIFEQRPIHHLLGSGCQKCNTSKGEIIIDNWLTEHQFKFEKQKRFSDCKYKKPLPFDFYISQLNLCIEFDGEQHFSNKIIGQERYLETVRNDEIKNDYCNKNNINLIRLSYKEREKINEILTNKLKIK